MKKYNEELEEEIEHPTPLFGWLDGMAGFLIGSFFYLLPVLVVGFFLYLSWRLLAPHIPPCSTMPIMFILLICKR